MRRGVAIGQPRDLSATAVLQFTVRCGTWFQFIVVTVYTFGRPLLFQVMLTTSVCSVGGCWIVLGLRYSSSGYSWVFCVVVKRVRSTSPAIET